MMFILNSSVITYATQKKNFVGLYGLKYNKFLYFTFIYILLNYI